MANEITNNGLLTDLRMNNMISQEIRLLLADSVSLRNTQYMTFVGSINGMGSDTIRVRKAGLDGFDAEQWSTFSGNPEADAVTNTALTDGHADVVVKRRSLAYAITDLAAMTELAGAGGLDPFRIAESIAKSYDGMVADLTADAYAAFTDVENTNTSAALTVSSFQSAFGKLQNKSGKSVPGPYVCVLDPKGFGELQDSIRQEQGAIKFNPATFDMISAKGDNYKGSFLGVDIYTSAYVTDDGTDHLQAMWAPGALGFATGAPQVIGASQVMQMDQVTVEMDRQSANATTRVIGHAYFGVSIIDDQRGVLLKSQR
jgi:hypothetical protein